MQGNGQTLLPLCSQLALALANLSWGLLSHVLGAGYCLMLILFLRMIHGTVWSKPCIYLAMVVLLLEVCPRLTVALCCHPLSHSLFTAFAQQPWQHAVV